MITSSVMSQYRTYLKSVYNASPIAPENKWPPPPSKEYVRLAVTKKCIRDDYIGHTLEGKIEELLLNREEISIEQILEPSGENLKLIFLEGAPGIGKSTLAWELCRKWDDFSCMKHYSLVFLLRLREEEVQRIANLDDLFHNSRRKSSLADEVDSNHGDSVLFIMDGFDELPEPLRQEGFLFDLIRGHVLPSSTVLVTSRPSASVQLLRSCRPQINKHIEILGFTQESVEAYACSVFSSEPEKLEKFKSYISVSKNPAINSLMYIPLNAAIVVEIYSSSKSDSILPHTMTELYTQLCLTILNRHLGDSEMVSSFEDLSDTSRQDFLNLSKLAFEGIEARKVIFHGLSSSFNHFGFLDAVSALYGGGGVSYNFLHLTLQEFFAAYYISTRDSSSTKSNYQGQWKVVWRFVAGLTKMKHFSDSFALIQRGLQKPSNVDMTMFLVHCLFEAQDFKYTEFNELRAGMYSNVREFDVHALCYCILNCLPGVALNISLPITNIELFIRCLEASSSSHANLKNLQLTAPIGSKRPALTHSRLSHLKTCNFLCKHLFSISFSECHLSSAELILLSEFISCSSVLKTVKLKFYECKLPYHEQRAILNLLDHITQSTVTSLTLHGTSCSTGGFSDDYFLVLMTLSTGKLQELSIRGSDNVAVYEELLSGLSKSALCSLKTLSIHSPDFSLLPCLKSNTSLISLKLYFNLPFRLRLHLKELLEHSKTLLHLKLKYLNLPDEEETLTVINTALSTNTTLRQIELYIGVHSLEGYPDITSYMKNRYGFLNLDPRIVWKKSKVSTRRIL